jgi:VWFA-related protein
MIFALVAVSMGLAQEPAPIRTSVTEVLLDVVARDKRGRVVKDLKPEEMEVFEGGVKQQIRSVRLISGADAITRAPGQAEQTKPLDPMHQLRLMTLVFDRLGPESRRLARQSGLDLIKEPLGQNVYLSVVWLDPNFRLLQGYTNDRARLKAAIERATGGGANVPTNETALTPALERTLAPATPGGDTNQNLSQQGGNFADAAMNAMMQRMQQFSDDLGRQQLGSNTLTGLLAAVRAQSIVEGRKTMLYFAEGLTLNQNNQFLFEALLGEANRYNVSFYSIDARGLAADSQMEKQRELIAFDSRRMNTSLENRQANVDVEKANESNFRNFQTNLLKLAEATGGVLIADTNDVRVPLRKVNEDVNTYYEIAYAPSNLEWDGKYRDIQVKLARTGLVLQTRAGYFALPPELMQVSLMPYEMPLLRAINARPQPRQLEFRAQSLRFRAAGNEVLCALTVEVPLKQLEVKRDEKTFLTHANVLVLFRDAAGKPVKKISRDVPYSGPIEKLPNFQEGNLSFTDHFTLPPGRYTMESAVLDRLNEKTSARRSVFLVPAVNPGLSISQMVLVRRVDPTPAQADGLDPFRMANGRIVPSLLNGVRAAGDAQAAFFFLMQVDRGATAKPTLILEFSQDGRPMARTPIELPAPDEQGRIPYVATVPLASFKPGEYELRAVLQQNQKAVEERFTFVVLE